MGREGWGGRQKKSQREVEADWQKETDVRFGRGELRLKRIS